MDRVASEKLSNHLVYIIYLMGNGQLGMLDVARIAATGRLPIESHYFPP